MENILLIVHLIIAIFLIAVVLLQRSEGGALGMGGGGGGGGGLVSARGAATALSKVTWMLAAAFIATSLTLTIIAASASGGRSVIQGVDTSVPEAGGTTAPADGGFALPSFDDDAASPTEPPAAD
ncbi:MAG: preprotein translocase subunit SecG [Pikeienuella sp.]